MSSKVRSRVVVTGRVQGVFEGAADAVARMVDWCRTGPPRSLVDSVSVHEEPATGEFARFAVR